MTAKSNASVQQPMATDDLTCPLCRYDLRGLTDPRCPECGFAFTWAELRDAQRDHHPWLFEHGRRRNVRSFLATYVRSAFPRRFWRTVTPANPVHVGRLLLYAGVANAVLALLVAVPLVRLAVDLARQDAATRSTFAPSPDRPGSFVGPDPAYAKPSAILRASLHGTIPTVPLTTVTVTEMDALAPRVGSARYFGQVWDAWWRASAGSDFDVAKQVAVAVVLAWPWLTLAALLVFQTSMRRAKVPFGHVLRTVVYGCDFALLAVVAALVLYGVTVNTSGYYSYGYNYGPRPLAMLIPPGPFHWTAMPALLAVVLCLAVTTYRMSVAYARYLRFDRPVLTVLAAQAMVVLAVAIGVSRTVRLF